MYKFKKEDLPLKIFRYIYFTEIGYYNRTVILEFSIFMIVYLIMKLF